MVRPTFKWRVENEDAPILLRVFLRERKQVSKRLLAAVKFKGGALKVNGDETTVRRVLNAGDEVTMVLPPEQKSDALQPEKLAFTIHYEDRDLLVVEKPARMATIPSIDQPTGSLASAVLFYYQQVGIEATFHAVNRLDRGTSGLLIVAKHRYAHDVLALAQRHGGVKRSYKALIAGTLPEESGIIDAPIGRKNGSIIEREVRVDGKTAVTVYQLVAHSKTYSHSLVSLELKTGRTHQIRVHLAYLGFPILGDGLYGGETNQFHHQALHCDELRLTQPFTGERLVFKTDLPSAWADCLNGMERNKPCKEE